MTNIEKMENQGFVEQDTALESMRASDFDCYSAYGEVIDNSIQAMATRVELHFKPQENNTRDIDTIFFVDNGHGMDKDLLHKCLKLGHSSRYNDRSGIGRFGVGMTLGAIHECRRLEVYSKIKGGEWNHTYLDLDEIRDKSLKYIPFPENKVPPSHLIKNLNDSGTVVKWTAYDKQVFPLKKIIPESHFWIGRTFRKFIWGKARGYEAVRIFVNGKEVKAFDPLYVNKENTGFEDEPKAELLNPQKFKWQIPLEAKSKQQKSEILINVSLLPDEYRRGRGKGGDSFAKERFIDRNEGVSILRNDREVFYGIIPYATKLGNSEAQINVNRFIGCEICFDAVLDNEFAVKHIKRGAVPIKALKDDIVKRLHPTFRTLREKISNRWNEREREAEQETEDKNFPIGISGRHSETNKLLKESKEQLLRGDKAGKGDDDHRIVDLLKPEGTEEDKAGVLDVLRSNGITIDEKEFFGSDFLDIEHGNGYKTLFYNTNSVFYKEYKLILNHIASKNSELAKDYKVLIDLVFAGYMIAESKIDPNENIDGATFMNEIKSNWANDLARMLKKWKD